MPSQKLFQSEVGKIFIVIICIWGFVNGNLLVIKLTAPTITHKKASPYYSPEAFKLPEEIKRKQVMKKKKRKNKQLKEIKLPIIMYHYVEYVKDENDVIKRKLAISPYYFDLQMKAFKDAGYETYFVRDIPRILAGELKVGSRSAVLTFDDGYEDFYMEAFPILKKYNLKATQYIIVNFIGRRGFLTNEEIKQLIDSGIVEIGAHTLDHVYLKKMRTDIAKDQITESKKQLENLFHVPIFSFAYPFGAFTEESIDLVKSASYSAAVTVIPGHTQSADNLFFMPRLRAGNLIPTILDKQLQEWGRYYPKEWK